MSIDISEGLAQDYSVINIFKIAVKPPEIIEIHKKEYTCISDFFCLQQIGLYRSNLISVRQLAELFYVLTFEFFNPENFKTVLEYNMFGGNFLECLRNVFDGNNNYSSSIFFRYKHRMEADEEKIGLKVNSNKELLVKNYQDSMNSKNFLINHPININEITTFVKHITTSGNIKYAADSGNDDTVSTIVNAADVFNKYSYKELVDSIAHELVTPSTLTYFNELLKNQEFQDYNKKNDYSSFLNVTKQRNFQENFNKNLSNLGKWLK